MFGQKLEQVVEKLVVVIAKKKVGMQVVVVDGDGDGLMGVLVAPFKEFFFQIGRKLQTFLRGSGVSEKCSSSSSSSFSPPLPSPPCHPPLPFKTRFLVWKSEPNFGKQKVLFHCLKKKRLKMFFSV